MSTIKYLTYGIDNSNPTHLICFSHLRWDFVYQRPQHLLSRFANKYKVYYIEEPVHDGTDNFLHITQPVDNITVVTPHLQDLEENNSVYWQKRLLNELFETKSIKNYIFWYYTPMPLMISDHFKPELIVYDCMDELSNFKFAPPELKEREDELFRRADIVFTGGHNLYQAKKNCHQNIYPFPSSIDKDHFMQARKKVQDPNDQSAIPFPRFGFYGVI